MIAKLSAALRRQWKWAVIAVIVGVAVYKMEFAPVPVTTRACAPRILCDCPADC